MKRTKGAARLWQLTALLAALLPAGAPMAQPLPPGAEAAPAVAPEDGDIVVTGNRDRDRTVQNYVASVTVRTREQLARFADPVCPASFGLPVSHNQVVAERIREVARQAGIRVAGRSCRPNVLIMTADSGEDVLAGLRRRRPGLFAGLDLSDLRRLGHAAGPVRAWQLVEERGSDGRATESISFIRIPNGTLMYVGATRQLNTLVGSRLERTVRQDVGLSVVIFDVDALEGLTLGQIADYAAMRALAPTDAEAAPSGRTILALFKDRRAGIAPADALTGLDTAYLRAVYATDYRLGGRQQQSNIVRAVGWALAHADGETVTAFSPGRLTPAQSNR